jgi:ABC-type sugar transport system ATPase subunit
MMAIELTDIRKAYGSHLVLDQYNCRFEDGTVTCVMGASGQGKTALLRLMLGLEQPDSGEIAGLSS